MKKEKSISINIYTAVRLCMFPLELMLNSEICVDEEYTV